MLVPSIYGFSTLLGVRSEIDPINWTHGMNHAQFSLIYHVSHMFSALHFRFHLRPHSIPPPKKQLWQKLLRLVKDYYLQLNLRVGQANFPFLFWDTAWCVLPCDPRKTKPSRSGKKGYTVHTNIWWKSNSEARFWVKGSLFLMNTIWKAKCTIYFEQPGNRWVRWRWQYKWLTPQWLEDENTTYKWTFGLAASGWKSMEKY